MDLHRIKKNKKFSSSSTMLKKVEVGKHGFSTLEMLIAMAIFVLVLSAIILVSFGNQSLLADSQTDNEALNLDQGLLEQEQALARKDFRLVNSFSTTTPDGFFHELVTVTLANTSGNITDYFTKRVTATVSWTGEHNRAQSVTLTTLVTNFSNAVGGDTCNSTLSGNWAVPQTTTKDFATLAGDSGSTYSVSDVDSYQNKLYVTADKTSAGTKETFFIFDITTPINPTLLGKLDNAPTTSVGPNSLVIATSSPTSGPANNYAYIANGYNADFTKCSPGPNCSQLQVIDIGNPSAPAIKVSYEIPTSTVPFIVAPSGKGFGNTLFYKDGYIYLGLAKTGGGPEFNIIDVHNPLSPVWIGGYTVGAAVNAIYVKNNYAYLATASTTGTLTILKISNPASPILAWVPVPGSFGNGKSLYTVGDMLYFGKTADPNTGEFYIFNNQNPSTISPTITAIKKLGESLDSLIVRDSLAFLLTKTSLRIINATNTVPIVTVNSLPAGGSTDPSFDCEGNYFYVGSNDTSNRGWLTIITALPQ